jgi:capsular polysaccharide transport system permease protein
MSEPQRNEATELEQARKAREAAAAATAAEDAAARARLAVTSRELRRRRLRRIALVSSLCVGLPTLLATIYYAALASPQYDSVAVVTIGGGDAISGKTPAAELDLLRWHMLAPAALDEMDREHRLIAHYQDGGVDWWSRLGADAGSDKIYKYYRKKVVVTHERDTATLTLRVRAFDPQVAQQVAAGLVESSRRYVDEQAAKAGAKIVNPVQRSVDAARKRLAAARAKLAAVPAGQTPDSELQLESDLAHEQVTAAMRKMEDARQEASRKEHELVVVMPPSLPDEASEPRPLWSISTVFVTTSALLGVIWLLIAAVREHSRF